MTEIEFRKMRDEHDRLSQAAAEARGTLKSLTARLRSEFKFIDMDAARAKLEQLKKEEAKAEKDLNAVAAAYKEEFPDE